MSDLHADAVSWLERYAAALGLQPPEIADIETLLNVAGVAAHASHRQAAPIACWLSALAGKTPSEALEIARSVEA